MTRTVRRAFTLIELLVVITIIVVLLALLTPALDKAIYQAELVSCAAGNLKAISSSVTVYAFDHRRNYPYRLALRHPDANWQAMQSASPLPADGRIPDDRAVIGNYLPINKVFNDPLGPGDVDYEDCDSDTFVYSGYGLWFGWKYSTEGRGLFKLGDRFAWREDSFEVLAADHARTFFGTGDYTLSSHPDADGILSPLIWQDRDYFTGGSVGLKMTLAFWGDKAAAGERGAVDMNVASADGSVRRHDRVAWNTDRADGMPRLSEFKQPNNTNEMWVLLPKGK